MLCIALPALVAVPRSTGIPLPFCFGKGYTLYQDVTFTMSCRLCAVGYLGGHGGILILCVWCAGFAGSSLLRLR